MKNILLFAILIIVLGTSCSKEDDPQMPTPILELTTIDSFSHNEATELLRLNILAKYGGVFRLLELYHAKVFDEGLPCDSTFNTTLNEDSLPEYSLTAPIEVNTNCTSALNVYNDRFYRSFHQLGSQSAESETFAIEVRLEDNQTIAGNFEDDIYTYSHLGNRNILITQGMAAELDPEAKLLLFFPLCNYDQENIVLTDVVEATFDLKVYTNEGDPVPLAEKKFKGIIRLIDGVWTVIYDDGNEDLL